MSDLPWEAWFTLAVVLATVVAMTRDWLAPAVAIVGADVVLLVSGVIDGRAAFSGFSNPAPITVAALFVVARAVEKTGALRPLLASALGPGNGRGNDGNGRPATAPDGPGGPGRGRLLRLLAPTAASSAFLNNTPIVAMLAPSLSDWAEKHGEAASRYLMPLSFATILGGTITVIGTSTNLVVSGLLVEHGLPPVGMFEIAWVGVPVAVIGLGLIILLAPRVLPDRRAARRQFAEESREYVVHQVVSRAGPLDGQTVEEAGLRHLQGVFLAEIQRQGQVIAPPAPTTVLQGGDRLTFAGRVDLVRDLQAIRGLMFEEHKHADGLDGAEHTFFEAVVSGNSSLAGKTLKDVSFRGRFQGAVLAIHRSGERVRSKLGDVRLKEGDTLLLLGDPGFADRWRDRGEFLLVSHLGGSPQPPSRRAIFVGAVTLAMVLLASLGVMPILHAALLAAITLVVGKSLTLSEARGAVNLDVVILIAAAFGIGAAMETSGLAAVIGAGLVDAVAAFGPVAVLVAVSLATVLLTELITNNAAAVLLFPIALSSAQQVGADPRPFAIAIMVAASASFLTPIGYQTNTMVYGLGGYRFSDYARLGAPLTLVVILAIALIVPLFWSF